MCVCVCVCVCVCIFPGDSVIRNPPAEQVGLIPGLGRSPEEDMAIHSSILAWRIPWTEEPDGLQSMGLQRVENDSATKHTYGFFLFS